MGSVLWRVRLYSSNAHAHKAVSQGHELKRKIPFHKGGVLWQWQFHVKKHGRKVTIPANDFALTSAAKETPKCYPGLSLDGWHYQMCVLGGTLH